MRLFWSAWAWLADGTLTAPPGEVQTANRGRCALRPGEVPGAFHGVSTARVPSVCDRQACASVVFLLPCFLFSAYQAGSYQIVFLLYPASCPTTTFLGTTASGSAAGLQKPAGGFRARAQAGPPARVYSSPSPSPCLQSSGTRSLGIDKPR